MAVDPLLGRTLGGKFTLESILGTGAMGAVYRARHVILDAVFAVKVMHEDIAVDPTFAARFHREARAASRLDHPNVIRVVDFGEEPDGHLYIVMEYVEGYDLFQLLRRDAPLSETRIVDLLAQALSGVAAAHDMGVVHRDLKPENIMVGPNDQVKLIDFGIAANAGSRRLTFAKLTEAMGTPDYISPEQVKGKRGDARSDIYSLGIMFYEMLTGKVPFTGPNPFVIMNERLLNDPIPPREVNPEISPQLQEIIYRALERDPNKRYPNTHEFALDLQHPEKVGVADRAEMKNWKQRRSPVARQIAFYIMLALIPVIVFGLMLFLARNK
jgi:serine/threonine-protein kinase